MIEARTSVVTIYTGDYLDRIRHLERKAEAAREAAGDGPRILADTPEYVRLAEEHDALVAEAEEKALHVKVKALGRRKWKALIAEHPPRKGNENDGELGVNEETFKEALVPLSIVEPELSEDDLDALSDVDYDRLYLTAFALNRAPGGDPKANLVSQMSRASDET